MTAEPHKAANPHVGPRAFRDGEELFGRDFETNALVDLLLADRIVLLHSQSGAGKTSLVQANVIPRLRREGLRVLPVARVGHDVGLATPRQFNRYVLSALTDFEERRDPEKLVDLTLDRFLDGRKEGTDAPTLLVFDQFEELLTLDATDIEAKTEFCRQAGAALRTRNRWAIFSMREEFVGGLSPFSSVDIIGRTLHHSRSQPAGGGPCPKSALCALPR